MRTHEIKLYTFEELSKEAQERALTDHASINVEDSWWFAGAVQEQVEELYEEAGLGINKAGLCFDLDRNDCLYFASTLKNGTRQYGIWVESTQKLADALFNAGAITDKLHAAILAGDLVLQADTRSYGGGCGRHYLDIGSQTEAGEAIVISIKTADALDEFMRDLERKSKNLLRDEYEYQTTEEAIKDTLIANEYEFTEDGKMWARSTCNDCDFGVTNYETTKEGRCSWCGRERE